MPYLQPGQMLDGRYRVDATIAKGGMSLVYRCTDTRLDRTVAAKVILDSYADDEAFLQRFQREAKAMAALSSPHMVTIYDFGATYLIMEFVDGGTLRELLRERGPMPPHAVVAVMEPILRALSVVHDAGMVHRDIKPDNVLINRQHQVKLSDFGLVRSQQSTTVTSDQIIGTVAYLSPEHLTGKVSHPASDIYSLGILMFELLTGSVPFQEGNDLQRAYQRLEHDVPAPSSCIQGVPRQFDEMVATACSRHLGDRYQHARQMLGQLLTAKQQLQLPAFKIPVPQQSAAMKTTQLVTGNVNPNSPTLHVQNRQPQQQAGPQPQRPAETAVYPGTAALTPPPVQQFPARPQPEPAAVQPEIPGLQQQPLPQQQPYYRPYRSRSILQQRFPHGVDRPIYNNNKLAWFLGVVVFLVLLALVANTAFHFAQSFTLNL